jgi:glycosyltransferase involved in cell wall biosynthesis
VRPSGRKRPLLALPERRMDTPPSHRPAPVVRLDPGEDCLPASSAIAPRHLVVVSHAWYDDLIGGSFRLATEFAESAAAQGHAVSYVCCAPPAMRALSSRERLRGVDVWRYPAPRDGAPRLSKLRHHVRESGRRVREIAAARPIEVLHGHSPLQFLGAARALHGTTVRKVYVVHSPFDDELLSNVHGAVAPWGLRLAAWLARRVDRECIQRADQVQTDSRYTLETMDLKHPDAMHGKGNVVPGWVDVQRFLPAADFRALRLGMGGDWNTDLPVFFTLRRLEARMGLDTLIEAAALLARHGRGFRVLIGGSGSLRDRLEQLVVDREVADVVRFLGRIPEEDLPRCYAAADCFVLPTRTLECFGLIVLESFAAGTPVIASNVAAIPELARVQGSEWLFEPGDVAGLSSRMNEFRAGRLRLSCPVRDFAESYSREKIAAAWTRAICVDDQREHSSSSSRPEWR